MFKACVHVCSITALAIALVSTAAAPSSALVPGTKCAPITDNSGTTSSNQDDAGVINLEINGTCNGYDSRMRDQFYVFSDTPIYIILNSNQTSGFVWLNNLEIQIHTPTLTNVKINNVAVNAERNKFLVSGQKIFTIQYDYNGSTYHFSTTIDAINHEIGGFTMQAGTAPDMPSPSAATEQLISSFVTNRANHIFNSQPDLGGFITGNNLGGGGPFGSLSGSGNENDLTLSFSTSRSRILAAHNKVSYQTVIAPVLSSSPGTSDEPDSDGNAETQIPVAYRQGTWDIWTEVYGSKSRSDTSDSSLWVGYAGVHYFLAQDHLIGVMGQLDWADESNSAINSDADGFGWMVGPYIAGKFANHNLFYEARVAYGQSDNTVSPDGTYSDDFETRRLLATGKLAGAFHYETVTIRPEARLAWYRETQDSYVDSLANVIAEQTVTLGELRVGSSIESPFILENGMQLIPRVGAFGVWNFDVNDNNASQAAGIGEDDLRARIDAGLAVSALDSGITLTSSAYYDGIGTNDYDSWGGKLKLTVPLN